MASVSPVTTRSQWLRSAAKWRTVLSHPGSSSGTRDAALSRSLRSRSAGPSEEQELDVFATGQPSRSSST